MKIGILSFAHLHAEAYIENLRRVPGVEMIGIADEVRARGEKYATLFESPLFESYEALLATKPDGVIVCSENSRHRQLVEMAAAAGVHVLCEKPLATTEADARAMLAACEQAGVLLMTAFPMRFSAPILQVKDRLEQGDFGQVYCLNTVNQGQMPINHRAWFVDKTLAGGGALIDHIVHLADVMHWYFDCPVTSVYAQANRIMHQDEVEVETAGLVMLTFENGVFATIDCSWNKPHHFPTWGGLGMEIVSESGLTILDSFRQNLNVFQTKPIGHHWAYWGSDANQAMINEFVAAIQESRQPAVTGEDGFAALAVTLAAYQSAATGQPVTPISYR